MTKGEASATRDEAFKNMLETDDFIVTKKQ